MNRAKLVDHGHWEYILRNYPDLKKTTTPSEQQFLVVLQYPINNPDFIALAYSGKVYRHIERMLSQSYLKKYPVTVVDLKTFKQYLIGKVEKENAPTVFIPQKLEKIINQKEHLFGQKNIDRFKEQIAVKKRIDLFWWYMPDSIQLPGTTYNGAVLEMTSDVYKSLLKHVHIEFDKERYFLARNMEKVIQGKFAPIIKRALRNVPEKQDPVTVNANGYSFYISDGQIKKAEFIGR